MQIPDRIKYFAKSCYGNFKVFCKELDISQSHLSHYLQGRRMPSLEMLQKFKEAGMSIDWLIDGEGDMFAQNEKGAMLKNEQIGKKSASQKAVPLHLNDIKDEILDLKLKISEQDDKFQMLEELKDLLEEKLSPRLAAAGRKKKADR